MLQDLLFGQENTRSILILGKIEIERERERERLSLQVF